MTGKFNEGLLKKWFIYSGFLQRVALISILLGSYANAGLTPEEFEIISFIALPCTALYLSFLFGYISGPKRYFSPGRTLDPLYFWSNLTPIIITGIIESALVIFKDSLFNGQPIFLYGSEGILEALFAIFAGLRLPVLFREPQR